MYSVENLGVLYMFFLFEDRGRGPVDFLLEHILEID
jgi:hypothetical protein